MQKYSKDKSTKGLPKKQTHRTLKRHKSPEKHKETTTEKHTITKKRHKN